MESRVLRTCLRVLLFLTSSMALFTSIRASPNSCRTAVDHALILMFSFPHSHSPYLFHLLEVKVEPPEAESSLQLRDGGQGVQEVLRWAEGRVRLGGTSLCNLCPLLVRGHEFGEKFVNHFSTEVGVVHAEDGCLDVAGSREPLDLNLNVVGTTLVQNRHYLTLLSLRLVYGGEGEGEREGEWEGGGEGNKEREGNTVN